MTITDLTAYREAHGRYTDVVHGGGQVITNPCVDVREYFADQVLARIRNIPKAQTYVDGMHIDNLMPDGGDAA